MVIDKMTGEFCECTEKRVISMIVDTVKEVREDVKSLHRKIDKINTTTEHNIRNIESSKVGKTEMNNFSESVSKEIKCLKTDVNNLKVKNSKAKVRVLVTLLSGAGAAICTMAWYIITHL